MKVNAVTMSSTTVDHQASEAADSHLQGIIGGMIGAATIIIWFLVLDTLNGKPLSTPSILGTVLFGREELTPGIENLPISFEMIFMYTWVHLLVFAALGGGVSLLLCFAEKRPNLGFGILLLFVLVEFGFTCVAFVFAEPVLHALAWPAVLLGNIFAAVAMGAYFWRRHPNLRINP